MNEPKQVGKGILYSLVVIFALMFAGSLLISLLLTFTSLTESSFSWFITAISFITLFIGGFIAGGKSKEKGWLSGGLTALCFSLTVLLFQYLGFGESFNLKQLLYHSGFLGVSMLGGIFGVNLQGSRA
ncbi:TIGR04086 family membrane protein [Bacillus haynesii]|uniref:TIGR04086 family membrane protein n=1 Tax=Bacillus haynesii TaxID=1925021 RepID=UPI0015949AF9|nr:TIGR04086 family membrane protein [Bacillus haynesii]NVB32745.1 TIGR04086 family membrane protein [Bacillus licheniformis]MCY7778593.1 TIGR04086 family membrane protein [Bacillus haynesii]MCY7815079.1 TIGR04086 family membrane protein [Bacillus haynesii]MCY8224454.1 TIGR04086 family membrane protein [Bacillus haynesii]MCY8241177.1 TIGR04086 family membrane protein [Bacillus haynesii]